uniref:TRYM protein n=1 Tax=Fopius arisanus TaxID=64838 RepID=A0A0C9RWE3_9HYME
MSSLLICSWLIFTSIFQYGDAIYKGKPVTSDFYYMVRIKGIMPECSGTIISYAHILTSAQCVYNKTRNNLLIIHDRDPMHVQHRHVETIIVHPLYNKNLQGIHTYSTPYKDIAVLKMSTSLLSSEYLTVLELPKVDLKPPYILCGIAGWGATQPHNPYSRNGLYWCFLEILSPARN